MNVEQSRKIVFLGGGLIRDFAFALTIGVLVGTYSSIFIASPVALFLDSVMAARAPERRSGGGTRRGGRRKAARTSS